MVKTDFDYEAYVGDSYSNVCDIRAVLDEQPYNLEDYKATQASIEVWRKKYVQI